MISANKEKYLLEIYENLNDDGYTRVSQLAKSLDVSVPSASKMAKRLKEENLIDFQRYGNITLTQKGEERAKQLALNHHILVHFFRLIGVKEEKVEEEVRNIESYISGEMILIMEHYLVENKKIE